MILGKDRVFIIAELSANHNNDLELAKKTIQSIADSGADAVKIQTYRPESLTLDVDNEFFGPKKDGPWKGRRPYDLFKEGSLPYEWHAELKTLAEHLGLVFFSSPFDLEGVDFLEALNTPIYKIASLEISHIPLITKVASTGKPIIISTGVARLEDIELAVNTCKKKGNSNITLLKCTSEYPAPLNKANLNTIPNLRETFQVNVGVSDHTMGSTVPIVSVALGARVIEKHFILDRKLGGPDSSFSMEPAEFKFMVQSVREAEVSLGSVNYDVELKASNRRRSIFVKNDIMLGEILTEEHLTIVRPGDGMHPKHYDSIIGTKATRNYKKGEPYGK